MILEISQCPTLNELLIGVVEFKEVRVQPSSQSLRAWSDEVALRAAAETDLPENEALRQQIRQMLRHGKFKASGRSKPAQEYLLRCATQDHKLPNINAPVDVLNTVSLACGLPISLLSIAKSSPRLHIRRGTSEESYVFNAAGQELDVEDLVVVCDRNRTPDKPIGSPIKDSMAGKIEINDDHLVAIIYGPQASSDRISVAKQQLIDRFSLYEVGRGASVDLGKA